MGKTKLGEDKMQDNHILEWLKVTRIPLAVISRHTSISRKSLSNWRNGSTPSTSSLIKLEKYYESSISVEKERITINNNSGNIVDPHYVVNLQKQHIKNMENQQLQDNVWNLLDYDVTQEIQLKRNGWVPVAITRKMISYGNAKIWEEVLGYSKKELDAYFDCGGVYPLFDHPVHGIITKDSNTYLENIGKNFLTLFQLLKNAVGSYYIPFHLTYKSKDNKKVPSVAYCMIDWKTMLVDVKVKFFPTT
tara:strand:- start:442 stop:1185 length:744 start_codon:yes stop_codon:yes gene_type:complete